MNKYTIFFGLGIWLLTLIIVLLIWENVFSGINDLFSISITFPTILAEFKNTIRTILVIIMIFKGFIGVFSAYLAILKGYNGTVWFAFGLFFGFFALFTIAFIPNKYTEFKLAIIAQGLRKNIKMDEQNTKIDLQQQFICKICGEKTPITLTYCEYCGVTQ